MTQIQPDQHNANQGTKRGRELLRQSLKELGAGRSILLDKDGNIIAGNKTFEGAQEVGLKVRVVKAERGELVAVQREDLDLNDPTGEARRLAYLDNRVSELDLAWDPEQLAEDLQAGMDLDALGFLEKELKELLAEIDAPQERDVPEPDLEHADELVEKWGVAEGHLWQLGGHLLAVGDCTDPEVMNALMQGERAQITWTDPPWNVDYGGEIEEENPQGYKKRTMKNDNLGEAFPAFVQAAVKSIWDHSTPGAILYMVMSAQEWPTVDQALRDKGFHWSSTIIWAKDQLVLSRKDYHTQYEPMWYGWKGDAARLIELLDRKQSDVWFIDRPRKSEEHPTMKPVELVERALINSSRPGSLVLDPFCGSGTTLVACERLGRYCRTVELDPVYAAVAIERWHKMTGMAANKLLDFTPSRGILSDTA